MRAAAPICSAADLSRWQPDPDMLLELIPLFNCDYFWDDNGQCRKATRSTSRILYCHDMAGNYLEADKNYGFTSVFPAFRFTRWHLIDIFVYFSHNLVTLPPLSWINLAHRQGVRVYGTVIFEKTDSFDFRSIFRDAEPKTLNHIEFARHLNRVRQTLSFEGWLLNFEVNLPEPRTRNRVLEFIRELKRLGSEVIWYDSAAWSGLCAYQNCLTQENKPFFDAAQDGLFLNYNWNPVLLEKSQRIAQDAETSSRVFVGVDCFGRGCPGGGGWNTNVALQLILEAMLKRPQRPLSVALFAPGWPFENCDLTRATGDRIAAHQLISEADEKFWSLLEPWLTRIRGASQSCFALHRPTILSIPGGVLTSGDKASGVILRTTCCTGQGLLNGKQGYGSSMRCQDLIPTGRNCSAQLGPAKEYETSLNRTRVTQYACPDLKSGSGTCLWIRPTKPFSEKLFCELFSFAPGICYLTRTSAIQISVASFAHTDCDLTGYGDRHPPPISLFLDVGIPGDDGTGELGRRLILSPSNVTSESCNSRLWILLEFSLASISVAEKKLDLHRFGIVWDYVADKSAWSNEGFLVDYICLSDSACPVFH
ncbi:Cytosolic endo-beta-N-acetylglucosaminidase [Clonorchis sinensis]|uniref:Cytosolic endo-beta-N-acetylglucosaminidase n=1 Tax=Clonorchis sinensis TaxID=79923 RepID=A0A8T1MWR8_CLOSI|nr:Cytosolic endo-beta-N-acetylglucosaminidase [Clonorchis sinensis]